MKIARLALTFALSMSVMSGVAAAGETVLGSGVLSCDGYLEAEETAKLSSENWVLGFLSSSNMRARNIDLLVNMDNGTVIEAIENYCTKHPEDSIADAAVGLLKSLVASADGDCADGAGMRQTSLLSLCSIPGAADSSDESLRWEMRTPGAE